MVGIRGSNGVTLYGGKNVVTGEVLGRASLVLSDIAKVDGAELPEDQMYSAEATIDADVNSSLDPSNGGTAHVSVHF